MQTSIDVRTLAEDASGSPRRMALTMTALSLLGLADAFYVAQAAATGRTMYCILFDGCNVVTQSPYGRFYGAPLSFLGVIFYLCAIGLSGLLTFDPLSRGLRAGALILSGIGVGYSAFSMYLQVQYIHALCSYCLISAVLTVLLLGAAASHFARTRQRIKQLWRVATREGQDTTSSRPRLLLVLGRPGGLTAADHGAGLPCTCRRESTW